MAQPLVFLYHYYTRGPVYVVHIYAIPCYGPTPCTYVSHFYMFLAQHTQIRFLVFRNLWKGGKCEAAFRLRNNTHTHTVCMAVLEIYTSEELYVRHRTCLLAISIPFRFLCCLCCCCGGCCSHGLGFGLTLLPSLCWCYSMLCICVLLPLPLLLCIYDTYKWCCCGSILFIDSSFYLFVFYLFGFFFWFFFRRLYKQNVRLCVLNMAYSIPGRCGFWFIKKMFKIWWHCFAWCNDGEFGSIDISFLSTERVSERVREFNECVCVFVCE